MRLHQRLVPRSVRQAFWSYVRRSTGLHDTGRPSFAQEGEDLVIARLLGLDDRVGPGFYVDVGAHHPERYSNTRYFYDRGWRGINVDPLPGTVAAFAAVRPRDIVMEVAVSDVSGDIDYVMFNEAALNGCDRELATKRDGQGGHKIVGMRKVPTATLSSILDRHLPPNTEIDFLSIDVEGHDLGVLQSNDWARYRPRLVLAEDATTTTLADVEAAPLTAFLRGVGYVPVSKCVLTMVFADSGRIRSTELGLRVG